MAIYELRTYQLYTGKLGEAVELYKTIGWPALPVRVSIPAAR